VSSFFFAKANTDCIWTSDSAGITISYVAPCDFGNQSTVDSILNVIVSHLKRQDTSLKVLVLLNHRQLSFPDGNFSNFFSIGFDTLREIDDDYIFEYYSNQESISMGKNNGLNTFRSQQVPIDINSTNNKSAIKTLGIKIIYDIDYRLGKPIWNDLVKAVVYATNNSNIVKNEQRQDTIRYNTNGWYVSLTTIDTFAINKIIGRQAEPKKQDIAQETAKSKKYYWLYWLLGLTLIGVVFYKSRQHSR
jgi:hypothetical protein